MTARKELLESIRQYPGDEGSDKNNFRRTMNSIQKRVTSFFPFVSRIFIPFLSASLLWNRSISRLVQCWYLDWSTLCSWFVLYRRKKWMWKTNYREWNLWFNSFRWMFQYDSNGNQSEFNGRWNLSIRARLRRSKSFRSIAITQDNRWSFFRAFALSLHLVYSAIFVNVIVIFNQIFNHSIYAFICSDKIHLVMICSYLINAKFSDLRVFSLSRSFASVCSTVCACVCDFYSHL